MRLHSSLTDLREVVSCALHTRLASQPIGLHPRRPPRTTLGTSMPVQIAGPIGPFLDQVQQRQVPVTVVALCDYRSNVPGDPMQVDQRVQMQMLQAIRDVIGRKMQSREL